MWKIKFQSKPGFYCIFARKYVKNYVFFSDFFAQKETLTDWRDISDNVHGKTTYNQRTATCNCSVGEALYSQVSCSWRVPDECVNRVVWSLKGRAHIGVICSSTFLSKDRHWRISNGKKQTINLIVFLPSENTSRGQKWLSKCQISTLCGRKWFPEPQNRLQVVRNLFFEAQYRLAEAHIWFAETKNRLSEVLNQLPEA